MHTSPPPVDLHVADSRRLSKHAPLTPFHAPRKCLCAPALTSAQHIKIVDLNRHPTASFAAWTKHSGGGWTPGQRSSPGKALLPLRPPSLRVRFVAFCGNQTAKSHPRLLQLDRGCADSIRGRSTRPTRTCLRPASPPGGRRSPGKRWP